MPPMAPSAGLFAQIHNAVVRRCIGHACSASPGARLGARSPLARDRPPEASQGTLAAVTSMGHEHHFLSRLDRVSLPHVELALSLYRDQPLLRFLLADVSLPDGAERVAISLDDPREGPFLIVTREGRFVTCLGKGMRAGDLPVVTRVQLDGRIARATAYRAQEEEQHRLLGPDGAAGVLLKRVVEAGNELSREEFLSISALQPLLALDFLKLQLRSTLNVVEMRARIVRLLKQTDRPKPVSHPLLRAYWRASWGIGHLAVLASMGGPELFDIDPEFADMMGTSSTVWTVRQGAVGVAIQGLWSVAKLGKALLPAYKRLYSTADSYIVLLDAALALTALGMRHTKLRTEIRGVIAAPPDYPAPGLNEIVELVTRAALVAFDDPEACSKIQRQIGARRCTEWTANQPVGSALRFERPEDVPEELAMSAALHDSTDFVIDTRHMPFPFFFLPWAARAPPELLYLPADLLRVMHEPWRPEHTVRLLHNWVQLDKVLPALARPEGPARKGPCPCGSGKKYKRCCAP